MIINAYTEESFLKRLDYLQPIRDYEIISPFIRGDLYILIKDKYGVCSVIAKTLFNGTKGNIRSAVDKSSYRINVFKELHNNLYEYPNYAYKDNSQEITLVCKLHGNQTVIESNHMKGFGCGGCVKKGAPSMTKEDFSKRMEQIDIEIEVLENYKGYHNHLLCKNKYGLIKIAPQGLLLGFTGSLKLAVDKTSYMVEQFREKHDNKYKYDSYKYCGNRCVGIITCPIHGDFYQMTDVHLMGSGCSVCSYLDSNRINGYSRDGFTYKAKNRECILYVVRMYDKNESFYKIGITSHPTEKRFSKSYDVKYNVEVVNEYKSFDAGFIWDLEKKLHREYKTFHYKPQIYFKGITECFNLSLPIEQIIENLKIL